MRGEGAQRQVLGPVPPVADLSVGQAGQAVADGRAARAEHLFDRVEGHAADEQHLARRCPRCLPSFGASHLHRLPALQIYETVRPWRARSQRREHGVSTRLVLRRLGLGFLTLWLVSLVIFAATLALPGDAAQAILGREATPERVAALRDQLNLDEPVVSQYVKWLGGIVTGDLGQSAATQAPVGELLSSRVGNSLFLVLVSALVAIPLSILVGVWTAMRRDRPVDHVVSTTSLILASLPEFVIGIALILLFATGVVQLFPAVSLLGPDQRAWDDPNVVVLPAATLVLAVVPYVSRIMRGSMVEVLESEYVTMAGLKGLSRRTVIWRHAVPNAIVPAIQVIALQLAYLAGGVVVVEFVFSYPGIGAALVEAVGNRDMPVVQAVVMLAAGIYVGLNLLADVATILVTPKLRTAGR
jgi:peptide/nickel transport system permease protein